MSAIASRFFGALGALLMASASWGAALTWTLNDVTFDDGASAVGTFDFDATTSNYSNIAITVTGFTNSQAYGPLGSNPYTYSNPVILGFSTDGRLVFIEEFVTSDPASDCLNSCQRTMLVEFAAPLTALGGSISIDPNVVSSESLENGIESDTHNIVGGSISASPVPVPAAAWLFGSALGLFGWLRHRSESPLDPDTEKTRFGAA
jgi:hypothetical protein